MRGYNQSTTGGSEGSLTDGALAMLRNKALAPSKDSYKVPKAANEVGKAFQTAHNSSGWDRKARWQRAFNFARSQMDIKSLDLGSRDADELSSLAAGPGARGSPPLPLTRRGSVTVGSVGLMGGSGTIAELRTPVALKEHLKRGRGARESGIQLVTLEAGLDAPLSEEEAAALVARFDQRRQMLGGAQAASLARAALTPAHRALRAWTNGVANNTPQTCTVIMGTLSSPEHIPTASASSTTAMTPAMTPASPAAMGGVAAPAGQSATEQMMSRGSGAGGADGDGNSKKPNPPLTPGGGPAPSLPGRHAVVLGSSSAAGGVSVIRRFSETGTSSGGSRGGSGGGIGIGLTAVRRSSVVGIDTSCINRGPHGGLLRVIVDSAAGESPLPSPLLVCQSGSSGRLTGGPHLGGIDATAIGTSDYSAPHRGFPADGSGSGGGVTARSTQGRPSSAGLRLPASPRLAAAAASVAAAVPTAESSPSLPPACFSPLRSGEVLPLLQPLRSAPLELVLPLLPGSAPGSPILNARSTSPVKAQPSLASTNSGEPRSPNGYGGTSGASTPPDLWPSVTSPLRSTLPPALPHAQSSPTVSSSILVAVTTAAAATTTGPASSGGGGIATTAAAGPVTGPTMIPVPPPALNKDMTGAGPTGAPRRHHARVSVPGEVACSPQSQPLPVMPRTPRLCFTTPGSPPMGTGLTRRLGAPKHVVGGGVSLSSGVAAASPAAAATAPDVGGISFSGGGVPGASASSNAEGADATAALPPWPAHPTSPLPMSATVGSATSSAVATSAPPCPHGAAYHRTYGSSPGLTANTLTVPTAPLSPTSPSPSPPVGGGPSTSAPTRRRSLAPAPPQQPPGGAAGAATPSLALAPPSPPSPMHRRVSVTGTAGITAAGGAIVSGLLGSRNSAPASPKTQPPGSPSQPTAPLTMPSSLIPILQARLSAPAASAAVVVGAIAGRSSPKGGSGSSSSCGSQGGSFQFGGSTSGGYRSSGGGSGVGSRGGYAGEGTSGSGSGAILMSAGATKRRSVTGSNDGAATVGSAGCAGNGGGLGGLFAVGVHKTLTPATGGAGDVIVSGAGGRTRASDSVMAEFRQVANEVRDELNREAEVAATVRHLTTELRSRMRAEGGEGVGAAGGKVGGKAAAWKGSQAGDPWRKW